MTGTRSRAPGPASVGWRTRLASFIRRERHLGVASKALRSSVKLGAVPYVAIHEAKTSTRAELEADRYDGLMFCHTVTDPTRSYVASYWHSEEAFRNYGPPFVKEHTNGVQVDPSGRISGYHHKSDAWWVSFQFWTVIITLGALISAFLSLWERGGQLLEGPDIYVEMSAENPVNIVSAGGMAKPLKFSIANRCRFAAVSVDVKGAFVKPEAGADAALNDVSRLSRIEPGASKEFLIRPVLPALSSTDLLPAYEVRLKAETTAGLLWTKSFDFRSPPLRMWPELAITPAALVAGPASRCSFRGTMYSGRVQNGMIRVTVWHPTVPIESVVVSIAVNETTVASTNPFTYRSPLGTVVKQVLSIPQLAEFTQYSYAVDVGIPGNGGSDCENVHIEPHAAEGAPR